MRYGVFYCPAFLNMKKPANELSIINLPQDVIYTRAAIDKYNASHYVWPEGRLCNTFVDLKTLIQLLEDHHLLNDLIKLELFPYMIGQDEDLQNY
jgi:hypothetical protein